MKKLHDELCELIEEEEEEDDAPTPEIKPIISKTCVCRECKVTKPVGAFKLENVKKKNLKHGEREYLWRRKTCTACCNEQRRARRQRPVVTETFELQEEFLKKRPWIVTDTQSNVEADDDTSKKKKQKKQKK